MLFCNKKKAIIMQCFSLCLLFSSKNFFYRQNHTSRVHTQTLSSIWLCFFHAVQKNFFQVKLTLIKIITVCKNKNIKKMCKKGVTFLILKIDILWDMKVISTTRSRSNLKKLPHSRNKNGTTTFSNILTCFLLIFF